MFTMSEMSKPYRSIDTTLPFMRQFLAAQYLSLDPAVLGRYVPLMHRLVLPRSKTLLSEPYVTTLHDYLTSPYVQREATDRIQKVRNFIQTAIAAKAISNVREQCDTTVDVVCRREAIQITEADRIIGAGRDVTKRWIREQLLQPLETTARGVWINPRELFDLCQLVDPEGYTPTDLTPPHAAQNAIV